MNKNYDWIWDTTITRINKGMFLPVANKHSKLWTGTDTEQLFKKNLLTEPDDWYYRTNPIEYKLNKHGYRTFEFDTIDWANSIVIFGCSNVFGVGVGEEDTLSSQLSKLINIPVINMGEGASSMEYSLYNSIILNEHYPTPVAVIHIWSSMYRTTHYERNTVTHTGSWSPKSIEMLGPFGSDDQTHGIVHGRMCQMISKQLWSQKTKYYASSFFDDACKRLNLPLVEHKIDQARDCSHPGRLTLGKLAQQIKQGLNL